MKPNVSDYATKELSQDAVICWSINWSGAQAEDESEQALRNRRRALLEALLSEHGAALRSGLSSTELH